VTKALVALFVLVASPTLADPCHYVPDRGPMPKELHKGATFSGPVRWIIDGDSLCVAGATEPRTWIEVRLADFYAPELHAPGGAQAKATLERVTGKTGNAGPGRWTVCTADHRSYDRIVALCRIGGASIGDLMRRAGQREGGNGLKRNPGP
jgi:endonuclease YncB( thermonuclease family)